MTPMKKGANALYTGVLPPCHPCRRKTIIIIIRLGAFSYGKTQMDTVLPLGVVGLKHPAIDLFIPNRSFEITINTH
jgi:hypothetical protein